MPSLTPRLPTPPSWRTSRAARPRCCCRSRRPARPASPTRPSRWARRSNGVFLDGCAVALDARENTMDAAGSLIEIWRERGIGENQRRGAFNYDPLGVLARTGTLYYPAQRSCEIAAKFAYDCRTMTNVTALLADGRPYHEAGAGEAQELAAMLATLVAYLRACESAGLRPRTAFAKIGAGAGRRRRSVPHDRQAARGAQARRACRRGVRGHACRRPDASVGCHVGAHDGAARSLGEHAAHHHRLRRRRAGRRGRRHRAALHLGARQARRLRPPHRPQHAPGAAGGKLARPRLRIRRTAPGSSRRSRDELAQKSWALFQDIEAKGGMGAALESGFIQGEIARTAEARAVWHRHGSPGADRRLGLPATCRRRRQGRPAPSSRARSSRAEPRSRRCRCGAWPSRSSCCATPPMPIWPLPASAPRCSWPASAILPPTRLARPGPGISSPPAASRPSPATAFTTPPTRARPSPTSGASLACICSSDAVYAELAEATAGALKAAGAAPGAAGRPAEGRRKPRCRRRASIRSFLLVATR